MSQVRILPGALRSPRATHATLFRGAGLDCPSPRDGPPARREEIELEAQLSVRVRRTLALAVVASAAVLLFAARLAARRGEGEAPAQARQGPEGPQVLQAAEASPQAPRNPDLGAQGSRHRPPGRREVHEAGPLLLAHAAGSQGRHLRVGQRPQGQAAEGRLAGDHLGARDDWRGGHLRPLARRAGPVGQHGGELHQRRAERVAPRRLRGSAHGLRGSRDPRPAPLSDRDLGGPQRPRHRAGRSPAGLGRSRSAT